MDGILKLWKFRELSSHWIDTQLRIEYVDGKIPDEAILTTEQLTVKYVQN